MKALGSTEELLGELVDLRQVEASGTLGGAVKCVDIKRNAGGESDTLGLTDSDSDFIRGRDLPDAEVRKPGEQTGLDTPVVLALNDVH